MTQPHAILRAQQRYGLTLTEADLVAMQAMVARRDADVLIVQQAASRSFVAIRWAGQCLYAIVSSVGAVVTFLPSSGVQNQNAPKQRARKRRNGAKLFRDSGVRGGRQGRGRRLRAEDEMVESGE